MVSDQRSRPRTELLAILDVANQYLSIDTQLVSANTDLVGHIPPPTSPTLDSSMSLSGPTSSNAAPSGLGGNPQAGPSTMSTATPSSPTQSATTQGTTLQPNTTPVDPLAGLTGDQFSAIMRIFAGAQNNAALAPKPAARSQRADTLLKLMSTIEKLTPSTYPLWATAVSDLISSVELFDYVEGTVTCPTDHGSPEFEKYVQESSAVRAVLVGTVSQEIQYRYLDGCKTPKLVWDALQARFKVSNKASLRATEERLVHLRLAEGGNLLDHVATFKRLMRELDGTTFALTADRAVEWLFKSLPTSYATFVTLQKQTMPDDKDPVFSDVCARLEAHYHTVESLSGPTAQAFAATVAPTAKGPAGWNIPRDLRGMKLTGAKNPALAARAENSCLMCLDVGHKSHNCPLKPWRLEVFGPPPAHLNRRAGGQGAGSSTWRQANVASVEPTGEVSANVAVVDDASFPECAAYAATVELQPETVLALAEGSGRGFILDSGCQLHMTCLGSLFIDMRACESPVTISGIGGRSIVARQKGTISIPIECGDGLYFLTLRNVLYAPDLNRNLISLGALYEDGYDIDFQMDVVTIYSNKDRKFECARAIRVDRLWELQVDSSVGSGRERSWHVEHTFPEAFVATTATAWHKRLGHASPAVLRQLASDGQITKLTKSDLDAVTKCDACAVGKGSRLPFGSSSSVASEPLELVHSDLTGPIEASVGGTRYVMSLIDDYSRMAWICLLKSKDEAFAAFKRMKAYLELSSGRRIKTLRTDGGGEYLSHAMDDFLADAGIAHQTTVPHTSQQNGVAERFFRTLFDRIRCMLAEAGMVWGWWAEAARAAVYIYNRLPHSHLSNSSSPLSVWLGKPVSVADIRIFGSKCYAIDTSKGRKKSAPRSVECKLLGFDTESKAYRLQVAGTVKVIKSRDVIFHEDGNLAGAEEVATWPADDLVDELADSVGEPASSVGERTDSVGESEGEVAEQPAAPRTKAELRRSKRLRQQRAKDLKAEANLAEVPKSPKEALSSPEAEGWQAAINSEYGSWDEKGVCEVVPRPVGVEILGSMLLFSRKTNPDGEEIRKKARCVVLGNQQSAPEFGAESGPTGSPVASQTAFRVLAGKATLEDCEFQQMDVKTAYLHAPLSRPTYIGIPPGYPESKLIPGLPRKDQALKLHRAVYGLREAPHAWYAHCSSKFIDEGFSRSDNDYCLFTITAPNSSDPCHVLVYVDDFTLVTKNKQQMLWLKEKLSGMFDVKDLGEADQVLGLEISRDRPNRTMTLTQRKFTKRLLEEYNMLECRPLDTPMFANATSSLPSYQTPLSEEEREFMRDKDYKRLLGCLNWLSQGTRPEIAFAVARLGQAQSNPHPAHWQALMHVLRYLSGTLDMGLTYSAKAIKPEAHMYTDSSYADCTDSRKSHSGYVALLAGAAISWSSRKQSVVALSSTEAEYIAMGHAARESRWLTRLLADVGLNLEEPMVIFADNQSSLLLADSEKLSNRTKHLDVQFHMVREEIRLKRCKFQWIPTNLNAADVFTKPLGPNIFINSPPMLGLPWKRRSFVDSGVSEPSSDGLKPRVGVLGDGVTGVGGPVPMAAPDRRS